MTDYSDTSSTQNRFEQFYATYGPKLWGIISHAQLPVKEAETIFVNTITKAWEQHRKIAEKQKYSIRQLLEIAYEEGLRVEPQQWDRPGRGLRRL